MMKSKDDMIQFETSIDQALDELESKQIDDRLQNEVTIMSKCLRMLARKRLDELPDEDVVIRYSRTGKVSVFHRIEDPSLDIVRCIPMQPSMMIRGVTRGSISVDNSDVSEYTEEKPISGGFIKLVVIIDRNSSIMKIRIEVLDQNKVRVPEFLCTIEDLDSGECYLDQMKIRIAYMNKDVGFGKYKFKIKSNEINGEIEIVFSDDKEKSGE